MVRTAEVIFENGVFRPLEPVSLPERRRFRIYILEEMPQTAEEKAAARAALIESFSRPLFQSNGKLPTRDELHDRR